MLSAVAGTARADSIFDAEASIAYDDNLSRASARADRRADTAAALALSARWFLTPTESDTLTLGGGAGGDGYARYHGLDNGWLAGTASYRHKFGLGFAAPWILVEAAASYHGYDVDLRTGPRYLLRAELGKRFSEALDARIAIFSDHRRSSFGDPDVPGISGKVFNLHGRSIDVGATYALTEDLAVSARAALRRGDVVSTASEASEAPTAATAITEDPTFGAEIYDYRLRGTTRTLAVTVSRALGNRSSLNLSYTGERTSAAGDLDYRSNAASLTFLYRY